MLIAISSLIVCLIFLFAFPYLVGFIRTILINCFFKTFIMDFVFLLNRIDYFILHFYLESLLILYYQIIYVLYLFYHTFYLINPFSYYSYILYLFSSYYLPIFVYPLCKILLFVNSIHI